MARGRVTKSHVILPSFGMMVLRNPSESAEATFVQLKRLAPTLTPEKFDIDADVPRSG